MNQCVLHLPVLDILASKHRAVDPAKAPPPMAKDCPVTMSMEEIRAANPTMDEDYGHRAELLLPAPPKALSAVEWDGLVDSLVSRKARRPPRAMLRRVQPPRGFHRLPALDPLGVLSLYTLDGSAATLAAAVHAGFFPYAVPYEIDGAADGTGAGSAAAAAAASPVPLEQRGLLSLELGGRGRERRGEMDPGGRIVLVASSEEEQQQQQREGGGLPVSRLGLSVGRKSLKTVAPLAGAQGVSSAASSSTVAHAYELAVCRSFDDTWARIVAAHGVDWAGFDVAREAFAALPRCDGGGDGGGDDDDDGTRVRALSIELWAGPVLASAEVGLLCGAAYTTLTLFADVALFPRCDRVRAQAATLWLHRCGVRLFDAGTTAGYYRDLFGFQRTTRREFVALWRQHRGGPLLHVGTGGTSGAAGISVRALLEEHRAVQLGQVPRSDGGGGGGGGGAAAAGGGGGSGGSGGGKSAVLVTGLPPDSCSEAVAAAAGAFGVVVRCTALPAGKAVLLFAEAGAMRRILAQGAIDVQGHRARVLAAPAGKKRKHGDCT